MVPDGWKEQYLSELCERITDGSHFSPPSLDEGIPIATVANMGSRSIELNSCALISEKDFALLERNGCRPRAGDVLFSKDGSVGKVLVMQNSSRLVLLSSIAILTPKCKELDSLFCGQCLKWPRMLRRLHGMRTGTAIKRVVLRDLRKLRLSVPPVSEQRKIAAILSSVDDAIEKTQAVIDQVQVVKRGLMQELLTRGLPGRHTRFKQTEIGEIPEDWELRTLSEVASVQTGLAKNKGNAGSLSVPYLRVANVQDGFLDLAEMKSVEVNEDALSRYALRAGDVLFTEGGDADKLGRGTVWSGEIDPCLHQNHVFVARSRGNLRPEFLSLYGGSSRGKEYFFNCSKQTTNLASMNSTQLKGLPVPIPRVDEQDEILERIGVFDHRLKLEEGYLDELNKLKSSLMSALLTGELRVTADCEAA